MNGTQVDTFNDVLIIGGGPAGSTAANFLARANVDALLIESESFPRWHIGESLLPIDLPMFEKLGVDPTKLGHLVKRGAIFVDERIGKECRFSFDQGLAGTPAYAYQVDRARFDHELLLRAAEVGARVVHGESAQSVEFDADGVTVQTSAGRRRARYLLDASGQGAFLARHFRSAQPIPEFGKSAVIRRYTDLSPAAAAELYEYGDIRILMLDGGWSWVIPIVGGELSVGMVNANGRGDPAFFERNYEQSPLLQRLCAGAQASPFRIHGNYSYRNLAPYGHRYACIGDAGTFLDPIFSSGVTLAFFSADRAVDLLVPALHAKNEADVDLMQPLKAYMEAPYATFERMIYRFYHTNMIQNLFFGESTNAEIRAGITSVLAGDVWRSDNAFAKMLLGRSRTQVGDAT